MLRNNQILQVLVAIFSLIALSHASPSNAHALSCEEDYKQCSLISEAVGIKSLHSQLFPFSFQFF